MQASEAYHAQSKELCSHLLHHTAHKQKLGSLTKNLPAICSKLKRSFKQNNFIKITTRDGDHETV